MTIIGRVGQVGRVRGDALCIGVIIYHGGSSVRHPKGARSIGIGHLRSGDRCTETLLYPIDPLWVAEQKSSFSATRKGSRPNAFAYCSFLKKVDSVSVTLLLILLNVDF